MLRDAGFAGVLKRTGVLDCSDDEFDFVMDVAPRSHDYHRVEHDISRLVNDSVGNEIVTILLDPVRQAG